MVGEACLWLIVIGAAVVGILWLAARLRLVVLPIGLALVLATLLAPPARILARRMHDGLAALLTILGFVAALTALVVVLAPHTIDSVQDLDVGITGGVDEVQSWLVDGPLGLSEEEVDSFVTQVETQLRENGGRIGRGALAGAVMAVELVAGLVLALVLLFFFLKDGPKIWTWIVGLAPPARRDDLHEMGDRAWAALGGFLRGQALVAAFDAIFIGLALVLLGVPLVIPLAVLTFFAAFIPIIGAFLAGLAAVLVALFSEGPVTAGLVLGAIVLVQQVEGNVFQPVIVGRTVHVHPVGILLAITLGTILAGIIGAMVAAPLVAVGSAVLDYLRENEAPRDDAGHAISMDEATDGSGALVVSRTP